MKNTKNTQQNEQLVPLGKYFKSILDDDKFGSSSVTRLSKSIILLYFLYWTTFNTLVENKNVLIDDTYWVRAAATKLINDIGSIRELRTIQTELKELVDMGFLYVYSGKGGSKKAANCYRPTYKCIQYFKNTGELKSILQDVGRYYKKRTGNNYDTEQMYNKLVANSMQQKIKTTDSI